MAASKQNKLINWIDERFPLCERTVAPLDSRRLGEPGDFRYPAAQVFPGGGRVLAGDGGGLFARHVYRIVEKIEYVV